MHSMGRVAVRLLAQIAQTGRRAQDLAQVDQEQTALGQTGLSQAELVLQVV
jgi:hypothetical protein